MRHNHPAEKADGSGWHYITGYSRGGYPLGYCAEHAPHATEVEARECYGQWRRDHVLLDGRSENWMGCDICDSPTKSQARIEGDGYRFAPLCDAHLTTEHAVSALGLDGRAGDSWES